MMPKRLCDRLLSGVSLAAALTGLSTGAFAAPGVGNNATVYASQGIPANGTITIPAGLSYVSPTFTVTGKACGNALLTFVLPAGVVFDTVPALSVPAGQKPSGFGNGNATTPTNTTGCNGAPVVANSPIGSGTLVVSVQYGNTAATVTTTGTLQLGAFQVSGATALSGAGFTAPSEVVLNYTGQASGATNTGGCASPTSLCQGATPFKGIFATGQSKLGAGYDAGVETGTADIVINVTAPGNGQKFNQASIAETNGVVADVGTLVFKASGVQNSTATAFFTFPGAPPTANVTLNGNFQGIASALLLAPGTVHGACPATNTAPAGSTSAAPSGGSLTFANVPVPVAASGPGGTETHEICLYASGTQLIGASGGAAGFVNPVLVPPGAGLASAGFATTVSLGAFSIPSDNLAAAVFGAASDTTTAGYNYNGTVATILYTQKNDINIGFVRLVNTNLTPTTCTELVQGDQGGAGSFGTASLAAEAPIGPQSNATLDVRDIVSAAGVTPGPFGRVSMTVLCTSFNVGVSNMEFAPGTNSLNYIP